MTPEIDPTEAWSTTPPSLLLDVRELDEWDAGHAPEATHVPLGELPGALLDLQHGRTIVCICRSGGRSARATDYLREHGYPAINLAGGMRAWAEAGLPVVTDGGRPGAVI
jgi:rhodanese-related sulfurtransferase